MSRPSEEEKLDDIDELNNLSDDEIDKEDDDIKAIKKMIKDKVEVSSKQESIEEFLKRNNLQDLVPFMT